MMEKFYVRKMGVRQVGREYQEVCASGPADQESVSAQPKKALHSMTRSVLPDLGAVYGVWAMGGSSGLAEGRRICVSREPDDLYVYANHMPRTFLRLHPSTGDGSLGGGVRVYLQMVSYEVRQGDLSSVTMWPSRGKRFGDPHGTIARDVGRSLWGSALRYQSRFEVAEPLFGQMYGAWIAGDGEKPAEAAGRAAVSTPDALYLCVRDTSLIVQLHDDYTKMVSVGEHAVSLRG
ncbi:hypothetical protein [Rhodococcus qingshengii]|uniref:hypothetical protein n=1 Tax=Rhodococcus qingshengii TaxID=334542 RepID=UPI0035DD9B2A